MKSTGTNIVTKVYLVFLLCFGLNSFTTISAQTKADDIIGIWEFKDKTSKMEIYKDGSKYYGKLLYGTQMMNEDGTSKKDVNNPNPKLKNQDIIGSTYIIDLEFDDDEWSNGKVYNANSGKYWDCYIKLKKGKLHFTGYMGARFLGKTYVYKRAK